MRYRAGFQSQAAENSPGEIRDQHLQETGMEEMGYLVVDNDEAGKEKSRVDQYNLQEGKKHLDPLARLAAAVDSVYAVVARAAIPVRLLSLRVERLELLLQDPSCKHLQPRGSTEEKQTPRVR